MTDRNEMQTDSGAPAQQQQEMPRGDRGAWYETPPARRPGLDTGARGWRWLLSPPQIAARPRG
jgi:hypothetical protein